jgi:predicted PurR-regulated permease PerM
VVISRVEIPKRTIFHVILTLALIFLLFELWSTLLVIFIAFLLAIALSPIVVRLERRGVPRVGAVTAIVLGLIGVLALVLWLLIPPLVDQGRSFAEDFDGYIAEIQSLVETNTAIDGQIENATGGSGANPSAIFSGFLRVGTNLVQGIANFVIVIVLAVYILIDGERIYNWVARYLPARQRAKVRRALPEISRVVSGYVIGQSINSTLFGLFSFTVLSIVGVPQPLLLALIAAFADAIPIAGVFIATVPAALVALTAPEGGITTAIIVVILYTAYQQLENYVIVPRVFGNTLQLSSFAILVAILIGGQLLGIIGVILALPLAAAIPVIEKIWGTDIAPGGALASGGPNRPNLGSLIAPTTSPVDQGRQAGGAEDPESRTGPVERRSSRRRPARARRRSRR